MKELVLLLTLTLTALSAILAGCTFARDEYYSYSGSPVYQGKGGAATRVNGIDLWVMGSPYCKYRIIGYLTDSRVAVQLVWRSGREI